MLLIEGIIYVSDDDSYRCGVRTNLDAPACIDIVYEEWDRIEEKFVEKTSISCIPRATMEALTKHAQYLFAIGEQ